MKNAGIIYPPQINLKRLFLGLAGLIFSLTALAIFFFPVVTKELQYQAKKVFAHNTALPEEKDEDLKIKIDLSDQNPEDKPTSLPSSENENFRLVVPKINVDTTVFANVDPADEEVFKEVLAKGVAHAKGSYLPGQLGSSYIFGHSTDYPWNVGWMNAVFYLLKELQPGDQVYIYYQDKRLDYQVSEKKIVEPKEVAFLKSRLSEERLILQTCWPPGTRLKRLLVISHPKTYSVDK